MAQPPRIDELAVAATDVQTYLSVALGEVAVNGDGWAQLVKALDRAAAQAAWARDAAAVLARRAEVSWPRMQELSGIPDSTLHNRVQRFIDWREYDR